MESKISTYKELTRLVNYFASEGLNIIVVGAPGLSKTTIIEQAVGDLGRKLDGNVTAFELYKLLYRHRDELIILDDIDSLYNNQSAVRLLKQACQTTDAKTVSWFSKAPDIGDGADQVPATFETTSRFIIIANEWKTKNQNVSAIVDRGVLLRFEPSAQEVHRYVSGWFQDDDVLRFIELLLPAATAVSARVYIQASHLRRAGLPWQEMVCSTLGVSERTLKLIELESSSLKPMERARAYQESVGVSQAAYYRHRSKLTSEARKQTIQPKEVSTCAS
jgi:hypothetical protein